MILHETIGAMVGTGIGALRVSVRGEGATGSLEVVAATLADHPSDLAEIRADRLEPGEPVTGPSKGPRWGSLLSRSGTAFGGYFFGPVDRLWATAVWIKA